jgi:hypothetical protein
MVDAIAAVRPFAAHALDINSLAQAIRLALEAAILERV